MDGEPVGDSFILVFDLQQRISVMFESLGVRVHLLHRIPSSEQMLQRPLRMIGQLVMMGEFFTNRVEVLLMVLLDRFGEHSVQSPRFCRGNVATDDFTQLGLENRVDRTPTV